MTVENAVCFWVSNSLHRTEGTLNASTLFKSSISLLLPPHKKEERTKASPINNQTWPRFIDFFLLNIYTFFSFLVDRRNDKIIINLTYKLDNIHF